LLTRSTWVGLKSKGISWSRVGRYSEKAVKAMPASVVSMAEDPSRSPFWSWRECRPISAGYGNRLSIGRIARLCSTCRIDRFFLAEVVGKEEEIGEVDAIVAVEIADEPHASEFAVEIAG
jgi:hypothetical protein